MGDRYDGDDRRAYALPLQGFLPSMATNELIGLAFAKSMPVYIVRTGHLSHEMLPGFGRKHAARDMLTYPNPAFHGPHDYLLSQDTGFRTVISTRQEVATPLTGQTDYQSQKQFNIPPQELGTRTALCTVEWVMVAPSWQHLGMD
jgi:hypothetical protein